MFRIKKLYLFILQTFLPLFLMTFFICLFIVLMQFLWMYVDEMVGKGLELSILAELFFYAAVTFVPLSLPLSLLMASLITFGNLGERFELLAIKAAGVSLMKILRPLIVLVVFIAVGAFFFQNDILPIANMKMRALMISMRQKSPELDIPEGVFYDEIQGYNLFVKKKDRNTGTLYDVMIYDVSKGFEDMMVIVADSGNLKLTEDKHYLFLTLHTGESFQNLKNQSSSKNSIPYRRETFSLKDILIEFDANFNRVDESTEQDRYTAKNVKQLQYGVDSLTSQVDSIGVVNAAGLKRIDYFKMSDLAQKTVADTLLEVDAQPKINLDSIYAKMDIQRYQSVLDRARTRAQSVRQDYEFRSYTINDIKWYQRRYIIEMHRKFTLSFACLIFFFIGAPLGAIIRKGGLGLPAIISVLFFIFYYIIDHFGYQMARDGVWTVWFGVWFSSIILLPIAAFLTYKAAIDSDVFNKDMYLNIMRSLFGKVSARNIEPKELIINEVKGVEAVEAIDSLTLRCNEYLKLIGGDKAQSFVNYWIKGYDLQELRVLSNKLESLIEYLSNTRYKEVLYKLNDYPILRRLLFYKPAKRRWVAFVFMCVFPLSLPLYYVGSRYQKGLRKDIHEVVRLNEEVKNMLLKEGEKKEIDNSVKE